MTQNSHPYHGAKIVFATKHHKDEILKDLFRLNFKASLVSAESIDTDLLGTFSGEIERKLSVKETLREKVSLAQSNSKSHLYLASEGTFGPHPWIPLVECNREMILFKDVKKDIEIFSEEISTLNRSLAAEVKNYGEVEEYLTQIDILEQAVILRPSPDYVGDLVFKGLSQQKSIEEAFKKIQSLGNKSVFIELDHRAHLSGPRRKVILAAGEKLVEKLQSLCPDCGTPGFEMMDIIRGLKCSECGQASNYPDKEVWQCPAKECFYFENRPRLDGMTSIDPSECEWCNP